MIAYLEERISKSAVWSERLAVFLIPYFVLVVLLYRFENIDTPQLLASIGVGLIIASVSVILGVLAFVDIWSKGYRGGSKVVRSMFFSLIILTPLLYFVFLAIQLPLANDVSTNPYDPPEYIAAIAYRAVRAETGMNLIHEYTPEYASKIVLAYPQLQSRRYPASKARVFEAVRTIIEANEWPITASRGIHDSGSDTTEQAEAQRKTETVLEDNDTAKADILVEFVDRTRIFGFESDLVVRISSDNQNTLVDIRAASRWGYHDFGYNAKQISKFFGLLDANLLGTSGI